MTHQEYRERLDEILNTLGERHIMVEHRLIHLGMPEQNGKNIETRKAKQALIKLIKELVEEAKPAEKDQLAQSTLEDESRCRFYRYGGYNFALDQFEQNLLKALEEV